NHLAGFQLDTTVDTGPRTVGFKLFNATGGYMFRYGATVLQANQWYHVAGVYDATMQTLTVYLNAVLDNADPVATVPPSARSSSHNVLIGQRADSSGYGFIGTIDEVRVYNRALSQAEIQTDMNTAISPPSPDTSAPSAPSALSASAVSGGISLAWTA